MSSLIEFFDRTYLINLPERRDRLVEMKREFRKIGVSFPSDKVILFPAVKPTEKGDFQTVGVKGCFLSHLGVLREARDQGVSHVLVLEDDLSFFSFFRKHQDSLVQVIQKTEWDFAYLGHIQPVASNKTVVLERASRSFTTAHFLAFNGRVLDRLVNFLEEVLQRPGGHPLGGQCMLMVLMQYFSS